MSLAATALHSTVAVPLAAVNAAFVVLFGIFVVALLVLIVVVLTWAVRRDRTGRAAWKQRQLDRTIDDGESPPPEQ
jgi:hypothetical protein